MIHSFENKITAHNTYLEAAFSIKTIESIVEVVNVSRIFPVVIICDVFDKALDFILNLGVKYCRVFEIWRRKA